MIIVDCEQGTEEWEQARLGIPTASNYDKILTPKQLKVSTSDGYLLDLLADWMLGWPVQSWSSGLSERGTVMEDKAREWYEFTTGVEVERVGFVLRDDKLTGGSPDGFVGEKGGVEIKVPGPKSHIEYLLLDDDVNPHLGQIQGLMYLTGREWWDLVVYSEVLPPIVRRFERDEGYMVKLARALFIFNERLHEAKEKLSQYGRGGPTVSLDQIVDAFRMGRVG